MKTKRSYIICLLVALTMGLVCSNAFAWTQKFANGTELDLMGYVTQTAQYGVHEDYNTEHGWNTLLTNVVLETDYRFARTAHFFVSGKFTGDWIYDLKSDDRSWNDKQFNLSKNKGNKLYIDDEYWQILNECHLTWNPSDFFFRFGKQIVVWGETDGFRLMDQINPLDTRRGFGDVEFENTKIPIWLVRTEYNPKLASSWLSNLNLQFVFNPNVDFIPNASLTTGNDAGGIWAPQSYAPGPFPLGAAHIGSQTKQIEEPNGTSGFEYAFRISANVLSGTASFNYFYGRDNDPATISGGPPTFTPASDGRLILHPVARGNYPLQRFVGVTYSNDIPPLRSSALGGVAPVVRLESTYGFDYTYGVNNPLTHSDQFIQSDEFRISMGVDWKVKIPLLNERSFFMISPQIYYRKVMDWPDGVVGTGLKDIALTHGDLWTTTLMVSTNYLNSKLVPSVFWMRDWQDFGGGYSDFFRFQVAYNYTDEWQFTVGAIFFDGSQLNTGFEAFSEKDYVFFKIGYKWS